MLCKLLQLLSCLAAHVSVSDWLGLSIEMLCKLLQLLGSVGAWDVSVFHDGSLELHLLEVFLEMSCCGLLRLLCYIGSGCQRFPD